MASKYLAVDIGNGLRLAYREQLPPPGTPQAGTVVLIHGFPQTSYQFRHVLPLLAEKGYRCVAPDYRGAGGSSRPDKDFRKSTIVDDFVRLLEKLQISEQVHLIGHDIGGMIAFAFACRHPEFVKSVCWGECPLPGTKIYYRDRTEHAVQQFHFIFHCVPDLPEALLRGNERVYITHFLNKITYRLNAFTEEDVDYYTAAYSQPGALRCALNLYRAFEQDAKENMIAIKQYGKVNVPSMVLSGEHSRHRAEAEEMALEVTKMEKLEVGVVEGAAHYLAEENPQGFVDVVLGFFSGHF